MRSRAARKPRGDPRPRRSSIISSISAQRAENAAPTGACQRLYYSVPGDGGTGATSTIVVADKQ